MYQNTKRRKLHWIKWCIAPTLFMSEWIKNTAPALPERGRRVKLLNKTYLGIACFFAVSVMIMEVFLPEQLTLKIMLVYSICCVSRCNEIFMAFIKDAFDKLDPNKREANGLAYYERVQMALRSYLELIINYAILFYVLDACSKQYGYISQVFNKPFGDMLSAIYFSVITVVAIGYGDVYPIHPFGKFLVCYEVMTGTLLLVVSFTIYVNLSLRD